MKHANDVLAKRAAGRTALLGALLLAFVMPVSAQTVTASSRGADTANSIPPGTVTEGLRQQVASEILLQPLKFEATADGRGITTRAGSHELRIDAGGSTTIGDPDGATVRLRLEGADAKASPVGESLLSARSNYFLGNNSQKWRRAVPQFSHARVKRIYPGIDLVYYGNGRQLEHDYVVSAGSDPSKIRMRVDGGIARIDSATGDLVVARAARDFVRFERPVAYQLRFDGSRALVKARFHRNSDGSFGVALGRFDRGRELIVDPVLRYLTYLGGNLADSISDLQFGGATGNVYVLMSTHSTDLKSTVEATAACPAGCGPTNTAAFGNSTASDFYVAEFDPAGQTLMFATYVGGSSDDTAISLKVDTDGTIYLFGQSHSQDYPIVNAFNSSPPFTGMDGNGGLYYENVLTKLSADGSTLLYSTYFGDGTAADFQTEPFANHKLALGGSGIAYITGAVNFNDGAAGGSNGSFARGVSTFRTPLFSQGQQYIAKFDTTKTGDASLIYCTPIGINGAPVAAIVAALGVDSKQNLWIYGTSDNSGFPTATSNALQAQASSTLTPYLLELNAAGSQVSYATYFGGSGDDTAYDMQLDSNDNIYVLLNTQSTDYPSKNAAYTTLPQGNGWALTRFAPVVTGGTTPVATGAISVVYSTFTSDREENSIAVTAAGMVAVAGYGYSVPLKNNLATSGGDTFQVFDTNQSGDASVLASSYLGIPSGPTYKVAFDYHDDLWLAGNTGQGLSVVAPYQATCGDANCNDGFMARIQLLTLAPSTITFPATAVGATSAAMTATFSSQSLKSYYLTGNTLTDSTDFTASSNCPPILSPAASCAIIFTFTPKSPGAFTSTYTIEDLDNTGEPLTVLLNGTATGAAAGSPTPVLTPATLDFGTLTIGATSSAQNAALSNTGTAALTITSVAITGANSNSFAFTNGCTNTLSAGASCSIAVSCTPTTVGALTGTLAVNYPSPQAQQTVALSCTGAAAAAPQAALAAATADFATVTVGASSGAQTFTLTNAGNAALPITSISLAGGNAASFSIGSTTCTASLAAGASCTIAVTFAPTAPGGDSATLTVVDSVGTQTSALTGTGAATPSDFGLAATPDTATVAAGASTTFAVDVNSAKGTFTQPVTLSATGLPLGATVSFSPAAVTPGSSGATSTMTIDTSALSAANAAPSLGRVLGVPTLAVLLILPIGARRRSLIRLTGALGLVVVAMALQGCNGGFALPQASTVSSHSQTYTVTITGTSGSTTHSTSVQVTVDSGSSAPVT